jgi:hypothetical protein
MACGRICWNCPAAWWGATYEKQPQQTLAHRPRPRLAFRPSFLGANPLGVNFAIFWTAALIAVFYLLLSDGLRPHRSSLFLIPLFIFFAAVTFLRAEPMTTFLAYTFTMLTLTILAVTYLGGRWMQYSLADYVTPNLRPLSRTWSSARSPSQRRCANHRQKRA